MTHENNASWVQQRSCPVPLASSDRQSANDNAIASHIVAVLFSMDRSYVAWNLVPLMEKGTIEFRQPPHVKTVEDALYWATKTLFHARQGLRWTC